MFNLLINKGYSQWTTGAFPYLYTNPTNQQVGIGTTTPSEYLQVAGGNIDLNTTTKSYMIGSQKFLWNNGNSTNIYGGINSGNAGTFPTIDNTFYGYFTGNSVNTAIGNTFIGSNAGKSVITGSRNVLVGYTTGHLLTGGGDNTFSGYAAGCSTTVGNHNSFYGDESGFKNTIGNFNTGFGSYSMHENLVGENIVCLGTYAGYSTFANDNTFIGNKSGFFSTSGLQNTCLGSKSGYNNITGKENTILGAEADCGVGNLDNASAIGAKAVVMNTSQMILGNNAVNVGIGLSGDATGPRSKLEINSGAACTSGLQFTTLTSACAVTPNPGPGELGVDVDGKVIYVDGGSGGSVNTANNGLSLDASLTNVQLGQSLAGGGSAGQLLYDTEIPMNNFNLVFSDPTPGSIIGHSNSLGIGTLNPGAKLHVHKDVSLYSSFSIPIAMLIENNDYGTGIAPSSIGLSVITSNRNLFNYGVKSDVYEARINYAGYFTAILSPMLTPASQNTGGYFEASDAPVNYGVKAKAPRGDIAVNNFAVHGSAPKAPPIVSGTYTGFNVGVYGEAPTHPIGQLPVALLGTWAGYFNGDLAYAGSINNFSDSILKTNIQPLGQASNMLNQMKVHTFYFDTVTYSGFMNFPKNMQYGLLAQELENITPTLVTNTVLPPNLDSLGNTITPTVPVKMVDQLGLIPILIAGHKEQQSLIDSLQQSLADLKAIVANCCTMIQQGNTGHRNNTPVTLENNLTIILEQNSPNPFKEETDIKYTLPSEIKNASIIFYDKNGRVINQVTLKDRGQGNVHIFAPDLSSGMYTYSLIADGQVIETKVMVKTK